MIIFTILKYFILFYLFYGLLILVFANSIQTNNADTLILLGCGLRNDKPTENMKRRVNCAALYLKKNPNTKVIVSGGITGTNTISEASVMKELLCESGIESKRIYLEDKSLDTMDNMKYSKQFVQGKTVVCSNEFHVLRAKLIALRYGYCCKSIYCKTPLQHLFVRIGIEEVYIIKNMFDKK